MTNQNGARYLRGIYLRLAGTIALVVMVALGVNAFLSHRSFEHALAPELAKKVASVGASVRGLVLKAVEHQIPFSDLYGVEQVFDEAKDEMPDGAYMALTDPAGRVLHERWSRPKGIEQYLRDPKVLALAPQVDAVSPTVRVGDHYVVSMAIATPEQPLGMLHIGVDVAFIDSLVMDMMLDVLVVLVVSLFFTLELMHYLVGSKLDDALRGVADAFDRGGSGDFATRAGTAHQGGRAFSGLVRRLNATLERVNRTYSALEAQVLAQRKLPAHERVPGLAEVHADLQALGRRYQFGRQEAPPVRENEVGKVRAPLFMFILAEELTRSFLPAYVKDLQVPIPWLTPELVTGLPIALFMLIVALTQPVLGPYCERHGHRRTMLTGAAIASVGFLASSMAYNVLDLLLWRSFCALGYAMVFVAGQAFVLHHATAKTRARNFALFVGAIMAASVCGPSIGGILADNIGMKPTFFIAGLLALGSMLVIRQMPETQARDDAAAGRLPTLGEIGQLLRSRRFMTVTGLAAMPAKMLLTGVCFYLIPLYMAQVGSNQAMAGRLLMTYAAVMVLMGPFTATLATSSERMHWLVGGGLVVSGLGGLAMLSGTHVGWAFALVLLVGLGQSLSISAQSALVSEHCAPEVQRLGEGVVYGVYRLLERMGNAMGPLLAALLVSKLGYQTSFVIMGCGVMLCGAIYLLATRRAPAPEVVTA